MGILFGSFDPGAGVLHGKAVPGAGILMDKISGPEISRGDGNRSFFAIMHCVHFPVPSYQEKESHLGNMNTFIFCESHDL